MSHFTLEPIVVWCCVFLCRVIRLLILFGNVRSCTKCAWICAKTVYGECHWLLLWSHHFWWIDGCVRRPGRRIEIAILDQTALAWFRGYDWQSWSPFETAVHTWLIFSLGIDSAVVISGFVTAEVPLFSRDSILRLRSAAWPPNETADRRFQKGKLVFSYAQFLIPINITVSHSLNKFFKA